MLKAIILSIIGLVVSLFLIVKAEAVHLPLLFMLILAIAIGVIYPENGWALVLILAIILFIFGKVAMTTISQSPKPSVSYFLCNIAALPLLFGGLMGKFFLNTFKK